MEQYDFMKLECFQVSTALDNQNFLKKVISEEIVNKLKDISIKEQTMYINSVSSLQRACRLDYEINIKRKLNERI